MKKYTIGIDFGSLSGRCVLVDMENGLEVADLIYEYPHGVMSEILPDGTPLQIDWYLQHPQDYLDVLRYTIKETLERAGVQKEQVIGIGIDFTSCTMLPIKEDGTPLCFLKEYESEPNAYVKLWKHHAAQPWADRLNRIASERKEPFLERYGGKISSEWMFPKIWQILEESPKIYEATDNFVEAADWVVMQLTGRLVRNSSSAGYKAIWSNKEGFPSKDFFKSLDERLENVIEEKFKGEVVLIGSKAGEITAKAAELTGLAEGTDVAVAHLDAAGATVGAKITAPGKMLIMMGTSSCHMLLGEKEVTIPGICGYVENGIIPGYIGYEAGQSCVGDHFDWFTKNCVPSEYEEQACKNGMNIHQYLSYLAAEKEPGETGLIALDWWNGNRSVLVDGSLSGLLIGCTLQTKPEDIYRALIEATAFGTKKIIDNFTEYGVPVEEIVIAGGIAEKNPFMMQLYADILGKKVQIAGSKQNAALSSAIWASLAAGQERGGFDTLSDAVEVLGSIQKKEYVPNQKNTAVYELMYQEYVTLHDYFGRGTNDVMKRLKNLQSEIKGKRS